MKVKAGDRFGRLTAVHYVGGSKWECSCDCGGVATCLTNNLTRGNSTSCGCQRREGQFKHGMSKTPVHLAWRNMIQRCENPKDRAFHNYGGRGISVSPEWHEFSQFIADMGMRPEGYELDRIDNDGPYSKDNCRWVSKRDNLNNRRDNVNITHNGETLTIHQWSIRTGIPPRTIAYRHAEGWPVEEVLSPVKRFSNIKRHRREQKD